MNKFTKKELLLSLACNSLALLWAVAVFLVDFIGGANDGALLSVRLIYPIAALIGGVLPIILTITLGIHTERYFVKRAAAILVTGVAIQAVVNLLSIAAICLICFIGLCAAEILYEVLKIQDEATTAGERAVLMLSNPLVYWLVKYLWTAVIEFATAS